MRSIPRFVPSLRLLPIALLVLCLASPSAAERRLVEVPGSDVGLPFSPAAWSGDLLFLSGALANTPGTLEIVGDTSVQTTRTLANLDAVLEAAGLDRSRVIQVEVYLADARYAYDATRTLSAALAEAGVAPARTTFEADLAIPEARLEVAFVAAGRDVEIEQVVPEGWSTEARHQASWATRADGVLFLSMLTAEDPATGAFVGGDLTAQVDRTMANVDAVLDAAGLDAGDLVRCRVILPDPRDYGAMNDAYGAYFSERKVTAPPARATIRARLPNPEAKFGVQCTAASGGERRAVAAAGAPPSTRPFSPSIQVGERLFLSGMVGRGSNGFPPDLAEQTRITLDNLSKTLAAAGLDFGDVTNAVVYLNDPRHYAAMNTVYRDVVGSPPPARATIGTPLMTPAAWVEIQMTADAAGAEPAASETAPATD
ncbi:MAG: RidA family protein [Acidobacteriota bacterium]